MPLYVVHREGPVQINLPIIRGRNPKSSQQTWRSDAPKCNPSQEISARPPYISDEHVSCTAPATQNAFFQILFECPTPAIVFGNAKKTLTFSHFWQCTAGKNKNKAASGTFLGWRPCNPGFRTFLHPKRLFCSKRLHTKSVWPYASSGAWWGHAETKLGWWQGGFTQFKARFHWLFVTWMTDFWRG